MRSVGKGTILGLLVAVALVLSGWAQKAPLDVAIVWHQHQPLYWNRLTGEYELPWVRIHGVQEYIDSARISAEYPDVHVTFNLQPSLLWQTGGLHRDHTRGGGSGRSVRVHRRH